AGASAGQPSDTAAFLSRRDMPCAQEPMNRRIAVAGILVLFACGGSDDSASAHASPAASSDASLPEQRCSELGDYCLCSEPLANEGVYAPYQNPSDSTTKECGAMDATRGGVGTSALPVPFPAGTSAQHVFKIDNDSGSNGKLMHRLPDPLDLTGKTICVR